MSKQKQFRSGFIIFIVLLMIAMLAPFAAAQAEAPALKAQLYLGWDASADALSYPWQDVVPVGVRLNRDSYVYLLVVQADGRVTMNYPSPYLESEPDNIIWGGQGQDFLRFVSTGAQDGVLEFVFIASLEPLTSADIAQLSSAEGIRTARLSTAWFVVEYGEVEVDRAANIDETLKQASPLWTYYQYIVANGG